MAQSGKDDALNMLKAWFERDLSRCARWDRDVELVEHLADGTVRIRIYTDVHRFSISARPGAAYPEDPDERDPRIQYSYLGCIADTRKPRPGEDWMRGNDLRDGDLSEETWIGILGDIVSYGILRLQIQKLPTGIGRRGERVRHPQADEIPPTHTDDAPSRGTIWPTSMGPSIEADSSFRERLLHVAPAEDRPAILLATTYLLDAIGSKYGKHRYATGNPPAWTPPPDTPENRAADTTAAAAAHASGYPASDH